MPNKQDAVKLQHEQLAFWLETYNAWRRYDGDVVPQPMPFTPKQFGEIIEQTIATLREDMAKLNAPTPREQELEAQNKALWELVDKAERVMKSTEHGMSGDIKWESERGVSITLYNIRDLIAAIQKAKEVR